MAKNKSKKQKSPFGKYSIEQIMRVEANTYVIQVGSDIFDDGGNFFFSKKAAAVLHNRILDNLLDVIDAGDDEERADAIKCMLSLQIMPLRIN